MVTVASSAKKWYDRVVGWAGRDDIAGYCSPVADLGRPYLPASTRQRKGLCHDQGALDALVMSHQRPKMNPPIAFLDFGQTGNTGEVDDTRCNALRRAPYAAFNLQ